MLQRLVHKADFERLLASRSRLRSAHFAVHHVAGLPAVPAKPARLSVSTALSTASVEHVKQTVDNLISARWLGCVVPKRQARRAVTRTLIKRQMRSVFECHAQALPAGLWLLRLHQGFAVKEFVSANSEALKRAVRAELEGLIVTLLRRQSASQPGPAAC